MYRTIMVPLDGSALAERALPLAESLAAAGGGRLVLVRTPAQPAEMATPAAEVADAEAAQGTSEAAASAIPQASIVVALDRSEFSRAALAPAMQMARCLGLPLAIVQAAPAKDLFLDVDLKVAFGETDARQSLHDAAAAARAQGLPVTEVLVTGSLAGSPARAILATAEEFNAKMIVMATHGRTSLSRTLHRSVATEVVHGTAIPVLLVRP